MDEDFPLLEIELDMRHVLRVYAYSYKGGTRITVSVENDDAVVDSCSLDPLFCPFTGARNSADDADTAHLAAGITLRKANGKRLEACCHIEGNRLCLSAGGMELHHAFPYDPATGSKSGVGCSFPLRP